MILTGEMLVKLCCGGKGLFGTTICGGICLCTAQGRARALVGQGGGGGEGIAATFFCLLESLVFAIFFFSVETRSPIIFWSGSLACSLEKTKRKKETLEIRARQLLLLLLLPLSLPPPLPPKARECFAEEHATGLVGGQKQEVRKSDLVQSAPVRSGKRVEKKRKEQGVGWTGSQVGRNLQHPLPHKRY